MTDDSTTVGRNHDSPEEQFAWHINASMKVALENDTDVDTMAKICINTAMELYDHYGAGDDYNNFLEMVVDTGFETAEIEDFLDRTEGRR